MSSLDQQSKQKKVLSRREVDYLDGSDPVTALGGGYQNFENGTEIRLEDPTDNFDAINNFKFGSVSPMNVNAGNNFVAVDQFISPNKFGDFFSSHQQQILGAQESTFMNSFPSGGFNDGHLKGYQQFNIINEHKQQQQVSNIGSNQLYLAQQNQNSHQLQQQQQQLGIGSSNNLTSKQTKQNGSTGDQGQQKQQKLMNALKTNPQDLENILEEQEKQQLLQKKLKVESDSKPQQTLTKNPSSIQLSNYSPTREQIKRVESNNSLNGATATGNEQNGNSKNLQKIKGNVKNAYIKKITSLLNLQNQAQTTEQQQENQEHEQNCNSNDSGQDQRRGDNSDDSDDSRSKSYDNMKQEGGKKVMKNRESARNSRQRKKIYIELLEKKIKFLTTQIEEQCVNIEKSQKEINKILDNHSHIKAFVQTRHDYIQKIGELANAEKPNTEQLGYILDSLRLRIGAQGTSRQKAMSLYFRAIMKQFMQSTFPYLIYGYQENASEDQEFNRCVEIFKKICGIQNNEQQVFKFLPYLKKFLESRQNFKDCYTRMKKIRKSAFKREESIEKQLDGLSLLHPVQMGKFLKSLDKFRKLREIRLSRKSPSENSEASEIEQNQPKQQIPNQDKNTNKLRQQTAFNQYIGNNSYNGPPNNLTQGINNQFMQMQYPQMMNNPSIGMEMNEEIQFQQPMDLHIQKPVVIHTPYFYQNPLQMAPQQQLLPQKDINNFQKTGFNPSNIQPQMKTHQDRDQYYPQQQLQSSSLQQPPQQLQQQSFQKQFQYEQNQQPF